MEMRRTYTSLTNYADANGVALSSEIAARSTAHSELSVATDAGSSRKVAHRGVRGELGRRTPTKGRLSRSVKVFRASPLPERAFSSTSMRA